jgi:NADH-quinone oxidoreductase subunit G
MSNHYNMPHLPTAASPRVTIEVDGQNVEVPGDTNLLEALKAVGIETPHVCYHPYLPVSGNCRQCLVETEGPRGKMLIISCFTPVKAGMKVFTPRSSERVKTARKAVSEFMMLNHPLDCPICDKAGECTLQENYVEAGGNSSRLYPEVGKNYHGNPDHQFYDTKGQLRGGKRVDIGPRVMLDEERCVQCDRCVRLMRDVCHDEQLQLASRADKTYITTFPGRKLDHEYDLCVTDVCPTGAMTAKHFRFEQRVWMLSRTPSVSMDDSLGANIWIEHDHGYIFRLMPRCNPEVNRTWLSNTSRLAFQEFSKDRLPAGDIESLKSALKGDGKIAFVLGGSATNEDAAALKTLVQKLGDRAEVFVGTFAPVGTPDGISKSGDPVANRAGFALFGFNAPVESLAKRASEFKTLVTLSADLWGSDASKASALEVIPNRISISSKNDLTAKKSAIVFGVNHWSEVFGTMVNSRSILQKLSAAPTAPEKDLQPLYAVLFALAGENVLCAAEAYRKAVEFAPALSKFSFDAIHSTGELLDGVAV